MTLSIEKGKQVYVKMKAGESNISVYAEGVFKDTSADVIAQMHIDPVMRKKWDTAFNTLQRLETLDENSDILYQELKMPFPLTNRDFIVKRQYFSNQLHPDKAAKYGLKHKTNKYWLLVLNSVEWNAPVKKGLVRAENPISVMLFEEDPQNPKNTIYKMASQTDLKGNIPAWALNQAVGKGTLKVMESVEHVYHKNQRK